MFFSGKMRLMKEAWSDFLVEYLITTLCTPFEDSQVMYLCWLKIELQADQKMRIFFQQSWSMFSNSFNKMGSMAVYFLLLTGLCSANEPKCTQLFAVSWAAWDMWAVDWRCLDWGDVDSAWQCTLSCFPRIWPRCAAHWGHLLTTLHIVQYVSEAWHNCSRISHWQSGPIYICAMEERDCPTCGHHSLVLTFYKPKTRLLNLGLFHMHCNSQSPWNWCAAVWWVLSLFCIAFQVLTAEVDLGDSRNKIQGQNPYLGHCCCQSSCKDLLGWQGNRCPWCSTLFAAGQQGACS